MTKISQYPEIATPDVDDLLVGTDVENSNATKNFTVQSIIDLVGTVTTPTLEQVTDAGNTTTNDVEFNDGAKILFDNGSRLQKGTTNSYTGGNGGIAQVCSIDYELKWEAGRQYVMQQDGFTIREVSHTFTLTPGVNDDSTKGFVPDSRWILDNGDIYLCTDNTEGVAVWELQVPVDPRPYKVYTALLTQIPDDVPPTGVVLENTLGGSVTFGYQSEGDFEILLPFTIDTSKTYYMIASNVSESTTAQLYYNGGNSIGILVFENMGIIPRTLVNGFLENTSIEIRVYE